MPLDLTDYKWTFSEKRREIAAVTSPREVSITRVPPSSPDTVTTTDRNTRGITSIPLPGTSLLLTYRYIFQTFEKSNVRGGNFLTNSLICTFGENYFCACLRFSSLLHFTNEQK